MEHIWNIYIYIWKKYSVSRVWYSVQFQASLEFSRSTLKHKGTPVLPGSTSWIHTLEKMIFVRIQN